MEDHYALGLLCDCYLPPRTHRVREHHEHGVCVLGSSFSSGEVQQEYARALSRAFFLAPGLLRLDAYRTGGIATRKSVHVYLFLLFQ